MKNITITQKCKTNQRHKKISKHEKTKKYDYQKNIGWGRESSTTVHTSG